MVGIIGLAVLPRLLGAADYGRYVVALGAATVAAGVFSDWLVPAGLRLHPEAGAEGGELWRAMGWLSAATGACAAVVAGLLTLPLSTSMVAPAALLALASAMSRPLGARLRATDRASGYAAFATVSAGAALAVGSGLYLITRQPPVILAAVSLPPLVAAAWYAKRTRWPSNLPRPGSAWCNRALKFGLPIAVTAIGGQALLLADRYLLALLVDQAAAGRYAATYGAAEKLVGLPFAVLFAALYPVGARAWVQSRRDDAIELLRAMARVYSLMAGALVMFQAVSGRWLMGLLAGTQFRPPAPVPMLVSFGTWIWYLGILQHQALEWEKRTPTITALTLGTAALNIAVNVLLIPRLEVLGAAVATALSYGTYTVAATAVVGRHWTGCRVWDLRPLILAGTFSAVGVMLVHGSVGPALGLGAVFAYLIATWLCRAWRVRELRDLLRASVGRSLP